MKKGFTLIELLAVIIVTIVLIGAIVVIKNMTGNKNTETIVQSQSDISIQKSNVYEPGQLVQYDPVKNESCTSGDTCYKWRVITVGDIESNSTITLQMDHNIVNMVAWVNQADYNDNTNWGRHGNTNKGPITLLKALETATSTWDDSLKLNYTYDTSEAKCNYGILSCTNGVCTVAGNQITSSLKARMITGEEIRSLTIAAGAASGTNAYNWTLANSTTDTGYSFSSTSHVLGTGANGTGSTTLSWLVENTIDFSNSGATANTYGDINYGYWTLSLDGPHYAWHVSSAGDLYPNSSVDNDTNYGVRPVIEIPKSKLNK